MLSQGKNAYSSSAQRQFFFATRTFFHNKLLYMYVKCGNLVTARKVFNQLKERDCVSWNTIISAYTRHGYPHQAVTLFHHMKRTGFQPDKFTFASVLPACAKMGALEEGMDIHRSIMDRGILSDVVVASALVDMYAKCGSVEKASEVFDRMSQRDVLSWTAMIAGYAQNGFLEKALGTFKHMQLADVKPNYTTFASILSACAKMGALEQGIDIHQRILEGGFLSDVIVATALVDMYAKCGSIVKARRLFDRVSQRDVISWNAMIAGYAQSGFVAKALETFEQMQLAGVKPNSATFSSTLPACAKMGALEQGMDIHQSINDGEILLDVVNATALVDMYAKCGSIDRARELFNRIPQKNVVSWNAMIAGYAQIGFVEKALETFKQMQLAGVQPNCTTFTSILLACAKMGTLDQVITIHHSIIEGGFLSDIIVGNTVMDAYAKCGSIDKAHELFERMPQRNVVSWNAMIAGYAQNGFVEKALKTFKQMQLSGVQPDSTTFASILPACAKMGALEQGIDIHQSIKERGIFSDIVVATALVDMYAKCGCLDEAQELFDKIPHKDVISWNAMIAGYTQNGFVEKALETLRNMQLAGVKPDPTTSTSILPACAKMGALEQGMDIHQTIIEQGLFTDITVGNALVDMYAKCGRIDKACELFETMPRRNVVSWTAMIAGYTQNGFVGKALENFKKMHLAGVRPDSTTFASILSACAKMGALELGMDIHKNIMEGGYSSDITVENSLVDMYAKCERINKAHKMFDRMHQRDVISWNAIITGCAQNGFTEKALENFKEMQLTGAKPDSTTFASILSACAKIGALECGMDIHKSIEEGGFLSDIIVGNALVDMYSKCGSIDKAHKQLDKMSQRNVVSWTTIVAGYSQNGFFEKALKAFKHMQSVGVKPDLTTFACILPACAKMGALEHGTGIHKSIIEEGLFSDVVIANTLVDMYAKCGSIHKARELFERMPQRDVISWNAMVAGYAQIGFADKALETFKQMQLAGVKPNSATFASILPACAKMGALELGMDIHQRIMERGLCSDITVGNSLVDMYAKCGSMDKAHVMFDRMRQRNVVSWTAIIAGYAQNGFVEKALETFKQMQLAGVKPDSTTFASILPACAQMGALELGMDIHQTIKVGGFLSDVIVATALVDMYAKCGSIYKAREVFDMITQRDVISWNAMIAGYAQNGFCKDALKIFELMEDSGTYPDIVSFVCVLCACSYAGLVDEGCTYFNHMSNLYCISPTIEHCVCMVDLLARAGYLEDTLKFIIKISVKPVVVVWMSFLGACRSHMNLGLGVFTAMLLLDLDPNNTSTYVLLSNIYAEVGWWGEVHTVRRLMEDRGVKKSPGCSWIEDNKMIHIFGIGDGSHPQTQGTYAKLEKLTWEMKAAG